MQLARLAWHDGLYWQQPGTPKGTLALVALDRASQLVRFVDSHVPHLASVTVPSLGRWQQLLQAAGHTTTGVHRPPSLSQAPRK